MKSKGLNETQFLALLEKALAKATLDRTMASAIYEEVEREVRLANHLRSFEKFCEKGAIPDTSPETVSELHEQLAENFGKENVTIEPEEDGTSVAVEIALPDKTVSTRVKVQAPGEEDEENDAPFVPFPVALPEDPELVWALARRENFGPDEAVRALANIEEEFWASKKGQLLQKEGVEKSFAEFVSNVPAATLKESGIKRYHKDPETLKTLRLLQEAQGA